MTFGEKLARFTCVIGHSNVYEPWRQGQRHWLRANACRRCGEVNFWQVSRSSWRPLDL